MPAQGVWRRPWPNRPSVRRHHATDAAARRRWRTVDIVVTAVLGVAFGVVFWAWELSWACSAPPLDVFPPRSAIVTASS